MKNLALVLSLIIISSSSYASEVYIDQIGNSVTIDMLQENGSNRVNTESDPAIIDGDDINLVLSQIGDQNSADLYFSQNANSTDYTYIATGSFNEVISSIFGGLNNYFSVAITGDTNSISACKDIVNSTCNGIIVDNTQNTLAITGNNNEVNFALDSADSINNITMGGTAQSNFNIVNLTQTGTGTHVITVTLDGDNNLVDLIQN